MLIEKSLKLRSPVQRVWDVIWDIPAMAAMVPGVKKVEAMGGRQYRAVVTVKVSYIEVTFDLITTVTRWEPPLRLETTTDGKALMGLGHITQQQTLELIPIADNDTEARFRAEVRLAGRLATLGETIFRAKADQMAEAFAQAFQKKCESIETPNQGYELYRRSPSDAKAEDAIGEFRLGAVILAAGPSLRMGQPKQLLPWGGKTMLEQVVDNVLRAGIEEVVVVLGHRAEEIGEKLVGRPVRVVVNRDYEQGMTSSLICGVKALSEKCQGIMLVLGDQPAVDSNVIRRIATAFSGRGILVPVFQSKHGHPVIFSTSYREELLHLEDKAGGARSVIAAHRQEVREVSVDSEAVTRDIDDARDYQLMKERFLP